MIRHQKKWFTTAAALLLGVALVGPGASSASTKASTKVSSSSSTTVKRYTAAGTPSTIVGGVKTAVSIKLSNTTARDDDNTGLNVGAARITVPAGLGVSGSLAVSYVTPLGAQAWPATWLYTYNAATRIVELTNVRVQPGSYISVAVTVDSCLAGNYAWTTDVRQSNDFNGQNNKFSRVGSDPVTAITQPCKLAFTGQPADTFPTATITTAKYGYTPNTPVAVTVQNGAGATITDWASPITLGFSGGDATATLTGGGAATPTSGVATWAPSLNKKNPDGVPYQLTATSPGLTSATSNSFTVLYQAIVNCALTPVNCQTPTVPAPNGGSAQAGVNGNSDGTLNLDWNSNEPAPDCAGYTEAADTVAFNLSGGTISLVGLTKTITLTQPIPAGTSDKNADWQNQICFRSPNPFPGFEIADMLQLLSLAQAPTPTTGVFSAHTANQVVTDLGDPSKNRWQGLLFDCNLVGPLDACIVSRHVTVPATANAPGSVTFVLKVPAGDPWAR